MFGIARFSVKYPTTVIMMVLAILLLGYISFSRLGVDLLPDLNSPRLFVEIKAGDKPPEEMEEQFVSRLEAVAVRGSNVRNVASVTRVGQALVTVEYTWDADMDESFLDLQKTVADFSQGTDADDIIVSQHDPNAVPIVVAILSHPEVTDLNSLRQTAENIIRTEMIRLPGIAAVEIVGARTRELEILTDPHTLEAYGITSQQLRSVISGSNRNISGGSIVEMGRRYLIRGVGELTTTDDIENLIVAYKTPAVSRNLGESPGSSRTPIYLREIAQVRSILSDPENIVRFNGKQCLGLEVFREAQSNTIDAAATAREQLANLQVVLSGYDLEIIQDQSGFISSAVTEVEQTGLLGVLLAVLVLFVFLRRIGVTAVIAVSIPISIVATFNLMYFNGLSLNVMTLGGLALGAGMLVDNAIIVMENTFRHLEKGVPAREAAVLGAGEVGGAITSSTLTTIVVFLPIVYLHGAAGELFKEQAWTVAYSLLSSLFVAMAVVPMLCSRLLTKQNPLKQIKSMSFSGYGHFLRGVLARRWSVVLAAVVLVIAAALMVPIVGSEFMPTARQAELVIDLKLSEGTSLDHTEGVVRNLEAVIEQNFGDALDRIYSKIGPASSGSIGEELSDENSAVLYLQLSDDNTLPLSTMITGLDSLLADLPDAESKLSLEQTALKSTLGTTSAPLVVEITGKDLETLSDLAELVRDKLTAIDDLKNVEMNVRQGRPEINIVIDRTVAAQFSLDASQIGQELTNMLSGTGAGRMIHQGEYVDIVMRRPDVSLDELEGVLFETSAGRMVRLDEVARLEKDYAPREIVRNNQSRVALISAHIASERSFDKIVADVRQALADITLPAEYSLNITGEEKLREEEFGSLKFALLLAIILVYMVMAAQFESLLHPFVILLTIPLAGVGTVLLMLAMGTPFNIMSYIGVIMLAGIAVNDSIILVDRINRNRRQGDEIDNAIVSAGQTRIRPIIMTSITTVLALLPLTIGIGEGASLRSPMALAVIGGLFTSTALTLIVIPAVYRIIAGRFKISQIGESGTA